MLGEDNVGGSPPTLADSVEGRNAHSVTVAIGVIRLDDRVESGVRAG